MPVDSVLLTMLMRFNVMFIMYNLLCDCWLVKECLLPLFVVSASKERKRP